MNCGSWNVARTAAEIQAAMTAELLGEDDWGYSIGGPIGKPGGRNKLFFFFSLEFT